MSELRGRAILLTGGSRGLGPLIAEALAKRGAHLVLAARSVEGLRVVTDHLRGLGLRATGIAADLRESSDRERLVRDATATLGRIDILINNAGLETEGAYTDLQWPAIRETIEVNLVAPMALVHLVLPQMLARGTGHIVNVASIAAKSGAPCAATYSGTKAGLAEWTRALRLELASTGVTFSTVFPGYVRDVGMFARFRMHPPWFVSSCSPRQVVKAVLRVLDKKTIEAIINSGPVRYSFVINEAFPIVGDRLMRLAGVVDFQRRKVGK